MLSKSLSALTNGEIRLFGIFRDSPPLHFYLVQLGAFSYFLYRFASRDYTVYGFLPHEMFDYPRGFVLELWPLPFLHFTSFQFIYAVLPRPNPEAIFILQLVVIGACCLGIIGLFPRLCAAVAFGIGLHLTGMMASSNSIIDGGTLALCMLLILALSPSGNFYGFKNGVSLSKRSPNYHWPVFLVLLLIGSFYTYAGLNKIIDVGPHWPLVLHLENLAPVGIERSLFLGSRYANPFVSQLTSSYALSVGAGLVTMIGEVALVSVLFLPRFRLLLIGSMIVMHLLVFLVAGINFVGSSFILLFCLDWNVVARKAGVYYDDQCSFCIRSLKWVKYFDWFGRIQMLPISQIDLHRPEVDPALVQKAMCLVDENGEVYYGADAFEQIAARCPGLWGWAVLMKIPGVIYFARYVYRIVAENRMRLGCAVES